MLKRQHGFVNFPRGFFETLFGLAAIGIVALLAGAVYGVWWLATHVSIN